MKNPPKITERKYEGYVWMSDEANPQMLYGEEEFKFSSMSPPNPFVIEALLWSEDDQISVHVRHTGKYHIHEYNVCDLSKEKGAALVDKSFLPHRLKGVKKVKFKQLWLLEKDENCMDMPVLTMKALIFTGFELKSK